MQRNLPPIAAIRVFEAAARLQSFTQAAAELSISQAAVSYQIKALEDRIGAPLFLRAGKRIQLSATGLHLAQASTEALDLLSVAYNEVRNNARDLLRLSVIPTFASNWLAERLGAFQSAHPRIVIRLTTSRHLVDFHHDGVDVAIAVGSGNWPNFQCHELVRAEFTPMLAPKLLELVDGLNEPKDLLRVPLINPADPLWALWFDTAGVERAQIETGLGSDMGSQHLEGLAAAAGHGAAILTPFFHRRELAARRLIQPFDLLCSSNQSYWLCYPKARRRAPQIRAFRDWILDQIRRV
jgi:LysR family glycine cleavage system transcriptional activator